MDILPVFCDIDDFAGNRKGEEGTSTRRRGFSLGNSARNSVKETPYMLLKEKEYESPLDVVIKARRRDFYTFLQLQADLLTHSQLRGKVYVFVPRDDLQLFEAIINKSFVLVPMETVIMDFDYQGPFVDSWATQQIVKLLAAKIVAHEQYLILDSNTLINFGFDETFFLNAGQYIYAVGEYNNIAWELQSRNFLKLSGPDRLYGFRNVNQIFLKKNVVSLISYLEQLYNRNVLELLLAYSDGLCTDYWTEYTLYGLFCRCVIETSGHSFEHRDDVFHLAIKKANFKINFEQFLSQLKEERPLMVKFHKFRPIYDLSYDEYKDYVSRIKTAYS